MWSPTGTCLKYIGEVSANCPWALPGFVNIEKNLPELSLIDNVYWCGFHIDCFEQVNCKGILSPEICARAAHRHIEWLIAAEAKWFQIVYPSVCNSTLFKINSKEVHIEFCVNLVSYVLTFIESRPLLLRIGVSPCHPPLLPASLPPLSPII